MQINNDNFQPMFPKQSASENKKNALTEEELSVQDSFVTDTNELPEGKKTFSDKVKGFFIDVLDSPMLTTYPKITEEKKSEILNSLQPGDIILTTNASYPTWLTMEKIAGGSNYSHAGIYEGDGQMIEANTDVKGGGDWVVRTDLNEYLKGRMAIQVIRPPYESKEDLNAALDYAREQIGKPYDNSFRFDDEYIYCSELVYKALKAMPNQIYTPTHKIFKKEFVLPGDFQKIDGAEVVYDSKFNFAKGQLSMLPAAAGGVALAVGGGLLLGPVGAVVGFIGGTVATTLIGGKIQENKLEGKK